MSANVLICDDSNMARKQMARSLPEHFKTHLTLATNGEEALDAIKKGLGEIVFLDLNMPVMDGYQVLETLLKEDIETRVVVVSGDIQPEAHKRVEALGAIEFIKKPVDAEKISELVHQLDLEISAQSATAPAATAAPPPPAATPSTATPAAATKPGETSIDYLDCYQEVANVAMGQAADLLARVLNVFVLLPIPNVSMIELSELQMALVNTEDETISAVCQGFIGSGISGEALLIFNDSSFTDIATLMKYNGELNKSVELELLMDVASILIGACLKGIAEQLDVSFSQGHPVVLGQHVPLNNLLQSPNIKWKKNLAIEISYAIENYAIQCDLLILFTQESLSIMNNKVSYLLD